MRYPLWLERWIERECFGRRDVSLALAFRYWQRRQRARAVGRIVRTWRWIVDTPPWGRRGLRPFAEQERHFAQRTEAIDYWLRRAREELARGPYGRCVTGDLSARETAEPAPNLSWSEERRHSPALAMVNDPEQAMVPRGGYIAEAIRNHRAMVAARGPEVKSKTFPELFRWRHEDQA